MKVPAFDLSQQYAMLRDELLPALDAAMVGGNFILGHNVTLLEQEISNYTTTAFGIAVANGSDALHLALLACGIGPGDEVIVPAFTFFATAGAVARAGATPVFVDVDLGTFNIDVSQVASAITPRTKAVIPVHLYGQPADMASLMQTARSHGLYVIEDAAQAIGAKHAGQSVCTFGDLATLSFFPTKNLGAFGDAGMVVTDVPELAERVRTLRVHGSKLKYFHETLGYNSRLDEIQAVVLRTKLRRLNQWITARRQLADTYDRLIAERGLQDFVSTPTQIEGNDHVFHQYTIKAVHRDDLQVHLSQAGIGTAVYYPLPLHLQPVFEGLGYTRGQLPNSEQLSREVLSLPMFPELRPDQLEYVVDMIAMFYRR